jgi:tRNA G18 (ribose-2'-O)-methylase SpoU
LYLTGYTGHPPRREITKTAIGAEEWIPWESHPSPVPILEELKRDGWQIVSLELSDRSVNLLELNVAEKTCLVVGHELEGVPEGVLALSDVVTFVPMLGKKESLNVAVVAGVALHRLRFLP